MTLSQSLGDKLMEAGVVEDARPGPRPQSRGQRRGNPRSGVDFPDTPHGLLLLAQNPPQSRDKNNEEVGTASKNTNNQNNRTETQMETTNNTTIESNEKTNRTNGQSQGDFDSRALSVAERAVNVGEKVAESGIALKPVFKRRSAAGTAVLGGVIGGAVVAAGAGTAMALIPAQRTNDDIINAAATGFSAGAMLGAGIGFWLGAVEEEKSAK